MSLTTCLKKAGTALAAEDKAAVLARAGALRAEGLSATDAGRQAVDERLEMVRRLLAKESTAAAEPAAPELSAPASATADAQQAEPSEAEAEGAEAPAELAPMPAVTGIPHEAAQSAHRGTSFVPEERAGQEQRSFMAALEDAWAKAARIAGQDEKARERITEVFNDVADGYRVRYMRTLDARSRVMSSMITGSARFPVERNRKRMETERKRAEEASEFLSRGIKRLIRAARGPIDNSPESELESVRLRLAEREERQELMKAANAALRKGDDTALEELGLTAEQIAELKKGDFAGRKGFPDYKLTNNNAEIRRLRERLKSAEERMQDAAAGPVESERAGVRIVEDATDDRLRLIFDGRPSEAVREDLKANGFKWSPKNEAWQRQLTGNARQAAKVVLDKHYPTNDAGNVAMFQRTLGDQSPALKALSEQDELFALPKSAGKTVSEIAFDIDPTIKVTKQDAGGSYGAIERWRVTMPGDGGHADITIRKPNPYGPTVYGFNLRDGEMVDVVTERPGENSEAVPDDTEDIYIDASKMKEGGGGYKVYAIAGALAHNTGRIFIGDPNGVSPVAMRRRAEQMLSLALKYGTTDFLAPHPDQIHGEASIGVPPLKWVYGDDEGNAERLIALNVKAVENAYPAVKKIDFDVNTGHFLNTESGRRISREGLKRRADQLRDEADPALGAAAAGGTTLARAAWLRAVLREARGTGEAGGGRDGVLDQLVAVAGRSRHAAAGIFRRADEGVPGRQSVARVQSLADQIASAWENAPPIKVVQDLQDPSVDAAVRDEDARQRAKGATGSPSAFFHSGTVYIVAGEMASDLDVAKALFHEALGHAGLRAAFGDSLNSVLDRMAALYRPAVEAKGVAYGLGKMTDAGMQWGDPDKGLSPQAARRRAAEEVLAELAETRPESTWVQKAIAAIRTWLRENLSGVFGDMKLSDAEIIRSFIVPARNAIERGDAKAGEGLAFQRREMPVWYSELAKQVAAAKMNAAPAGGWQQFIRGLAAKGVKPDEIAWSGIEEWLGLQQGKVTREQVAEFLAGNGVQVQETVLGDASDDVDALNAKLPEGYSAEIDNIGGQAVFRWEDNEDGADELMDYADLPAHVQRIVDEHTSMTGGQSTKYGQYTIPGGANYREVLLTLPAKSTASPERAAYEQWASRNGLTPNATATEDRYNRETGLAAPPPRTMSAMDADAAQNYRSSHWDQPNVLAHIRLNDRTDASGARVLFVEEIQSDWGQEGKKRGFAGTPQGAAKNNGMTLAEWEALSPEDRAFTLEESRNSSTVTVPAAPFVTHTDKWVTLALKRVIKLAVDGGYDKVAFITGEQSAERYDLSKQVERVIFLDNKTGGVGRPSMDGAPGSGTLEAYNHEGRRVVDQYIEDPSKIADYVGKEIAQRLLESKPVASQRAGIGMRERALQGLDLKVGGEGMRAFYDSLVPSVLKDVLKKVGSGALTAVQIAGREVYVNRQTDDGRFIVRQAGDSGNYGIFDTKAEADAKAEQVRAAYALQQPGFTITPAMRERAAGGMPMFQRQADQTDTPEFLKWFGDSKVVDAEGKPLVVYHGTFADFSKFSDRRLGENTDDNASSEPYAQTSRVGFWFNTAPMGGSSAGYTVDMPVYLSIQNPKREMSLDWLAQGLESTKGRTYRRQLIAEGYDGLVLADEEFGGESWVAFRPEQIKSATGNRGTFDGTNPDIRFQRTAAQALPLTIDRKAITNRLADILRNPGAKVSWFQKTLGTQYAKAEKHAEFKPVFEAVQGYIEDVSTLANEAGDAAPQILPKLDGFQDLANKDKYGLTRKDAETLAGPVFDGTLRYARRDGKLVEFDDVLSEAEGMDSEAKAQRLLRDGHVTEAELKRWQATPLDIYDGAVRNRFESAYLQPGVVFTDKELRDLFGLSDAQISHYRQFRASVDASLDQVVAADALRLLGDASPELKQLALSRRGDLRPAIEEFIQSKIDSEPDQGLRDELAATWNDIADKFSRIEALKQRGYAPLMRFGKFFVSVRGADGEQDFFGLYETRAQANRIARELGEDPEFKGRVRQGVISQEAYKLFAGVPVDSLELFADTLGGDKSAAFQAWLRLTKNNRSALKRLIHRKGTAGYSEDVTRVLASFVTSNARMASGAMNLQRAKKLAEGIQAGDVQDEAVKLVDSVQNPSESAGAVRGLMFMHFIGGSIASALVNATQPVMMTLPYLSQWGGMAKASARMVAAAQQAVGGKINDRALAAALHRAEQDGIVSPQEIHHLTADAMATFGSNPWAKRLAFIWGAPFSLAEQFNRRVSFIAAYKTAKAEGMADPFEFAKRSVIETQGLYNKGNQPNLARNAIGATALTFKQYSIHYLEWLGRMWNVGEPGSAQRRNGRRAVLIALALLMAVGGAEGLPFAEDLDDLLDTAMQAMGLDTSAAGWKHDFLAKTLGLGDVATDVSLRGLSALPGIPLDVSIRMGMGNLIPGTGMMLRSSTDTSRDVLEFAGPFGGMVNQYKDASQKLLEGKPGEAALGVLPIALQNVSKAAKMWTTGEYRDRRDRKVMETDELDGLMKMLGFQPSAVARESNTINREMRRVQLVRNVETQIADLWAQGVRERDPAMVAEARQMLQDWNADNPASRISINSAQISRRVREMQRTRAERFERSAPKEIRPTLEAARP